jgi:hypothetical protein
MTAIVRTNVKALSLKLKSMTVSDRSNFTHHRKRGEKTGDRKQGRENRGEKTGERKQGRKRGEKTGRANAKRRGT